jgi:deazaflavin-dependent oxidoreductase (nitroreductase family)
MADQRLRRTFFGVLKRTINPLAMRAARSGHGPFSVVRHVGRRSGKTYETPLIVAAVADGFIAELTYGPNVSWYRNAVAAGNCVLVVGGVEHRIDAITPYAAEAGLRAFGFPRALILKALRRNEFRHLRAVPRETS